MRNKFGVGVAYDAGQVIGKTLKAKKDIPVYKSPIDSPDNKPMYSVKAGYPVGVVWSYLQPNGTDRTGLWWMFENDPYSKFKYYYVKHDPNGFDVSLIKQQMQAEGIKDVATLAQEAVDANLTLEQKIVKYAKYAGGAVLAFLLLREVIRKKL
jgi:hypothetical protein